MVFSSIEFLLYFLPIFLILYALTPKAYKNITLLVGSTVFYAMGELKFILLLMVSLVVNYLIGLDLAAAGRRSRRKENKRKFLLAAAVAGNVGVLLAFKLVAGRWGLPLGISFYTFQIISYLVDVYRGTVGRETSLLRFSTYVAMFPRVVSGPIVRYGEVEQSLKNPEMTAAGVQEGLKVFTMGLASKVLLADRIGLLWHQVQTTGFESISTPLAWLAAIAYSLEIYFDFYGYSLMAVGLGKMLGYDLPCNFREPYMAKSVREFYRRWHMTLGNWFKEYVYIPLGGNRCGELRTVGNLLVVWILTAVWHGSTLNFLIWGLLLWFFITMERLLEGVKVVKQMELFPRLYLWAVIPVTWMCFAIPEIADLQIYLGRMFRITEGINVSAGDWQRALADYKWLFVAGFVACTPLVGRIFHKIRNHIAGEFLLGILFWICVLQLIEAGENTFMYFRF